MRTTSSGEIYTPYTGAAEMLLHIYKRKVHNGQYGIVTFVITFRSQPGLTVNVYA